MAISNQDLKLPGTIVRNFACDLGFAAYEIFGEGPTGRLHAYRMQTNTQTPQMHISIKMFKLMIIIILASLYLLS